MKTNNTETIRWTSTPIEVAIALGLLGPAWAEGDDEDSDQHQAEKNYHPSSNYHQCTYHRVSGET